MGDNDKIKISFIIPTFNADRYIERCLKSIRDQDYPQSSIEIVIADRGSTDKTVEIANSYDCRVINDPEELPEPRAENCQKKVNGETIVFLSADNELTRKNWLEKMIKPFENDNVYGVFTPIINSHDEKAFTRYFNLLQRDPFSWYIIGKVNPHNVAKKFPVLSENEDYIIFNYTTDRYDLIAYHQGFVVRNGFQRSKDTSFDDILPVIEIIENGHKIAYEKHAGIYHHTLDSFGHFMKKFHARIYERITNPNYGYRMRSKYMSGQMKIRQYLWLIYSLTFIGPIIDMIRGFRKDKSIYWGYHPLACFSLSCSILVNYLRAVCVRLFKKVLNLSPSS